MVFANIEYLFLVVSQVSVVVWYIMRRKNSEATLQISDARVYAHAPKSYKNYLLHAPFVLRIIALTLIIIVLARPQTTDSWQNSEIEGIDIMLAIDVSTSMLAEDLKPNRLEAAKDVAARQRIYEFGWHEWCWLHWWLQSDYLSDGGAAGGCILFT